VSKRLVGKITRNVLPPVITKAARGVRDHFKNSEVASENPDVLFDGDDLFFKEIVFKAGVYGEYGVGKSTTWVLKNTKAEVIASDTDIKWINKIKQQNSALDLQRLDAIHVDLGTLAKWGRPVDYSKREGFQKYTDEIWMKSKKPDVVLVDGRFRVCCFLTSLKYANEGAVILFDDYINRPNYHIVEEFIQRKDVCGRQGIFVVPAKWNVDDAKVNEYIERFRYVMD